MDSILRLKERIVEAMALDELDDSSSSPLVSAEALQLIHRGKKMRNTKSGVEQTLRDYQVLNGCLLVVSAAPWLPGSSDGTELAGPTRPGLPNQPRPKTLHNGWSSASRGVTGRCHSPPFPLIAPFSNTCAFRCGFSSTPMLPRH